MSLDYCGTSIVFSLVDNMSASETDANVFAKEDLPILAFPVMEQIRRQGKLCDVTLKIGENKFSAHRIVLASSIPYFNAMFTHDMVETRQDEITMEGIEPSALESLINYAYNGRIKLDPGNVQDVFVGASFLQLQCVKDACCEFIRARMNPSNVLGVRSFAEQFMCKGLIEACDKYLQKYFVQVSKTDEFVNLTQREVMDILDRDELYVTSEEQVYEAVINWIKKDIELRGDAIAELLIKVRLPLLMPHILTDLVGREELVKKSFKCRDLLDEAKDYHLMPERRSKMSSFKIRPRCCKDIVGIIYAVGGLTSTGVSISTVEAYDPILRRWQVAKPMKTLRSRVGVAVLKGKLYAIGGYDGSERLNTVEVFDPEQNRWKLVAHMMCKRSALGAASLDNKVYVCGGYDGVSSLNSVECYDPEKNSWSMVSRMTRHRSAAGVTVFDSLIYALGGHDGLSIFDSVECYNTLTSSWSQVASMLSKRCRLGVASMNGKLYAAGGYDGSIFLHTVECYDPMTNQWTEVAPMHGKRSRVAVVANCGKLYAIGGYDGLQNLNSAECYDPEKNSWICSPAMCAHEGGVGVGVIPIEPIT